MLSVILPIRITPATAYLAERLEANLALFAPHDELECIVVDSASDPTYRERIRRAAAAHPRCHVIDDPTPQSPFAPGLTRNVGANHATGDTLLFYDADLCCQADFVDRVQAWARATRDPADFLMVPCLYLTRRATEQLAFDGRPVDLIPHLRSVLAGENELVTHIAVSTSTIAVSRDHFLALGGNRADYRGHGAEDLDLIHRLASYRALGARPDDYYDDVKTRFVGDYRGFRAYWARYALPRLFEGLFTAHLWHSRPLQRAYFRRRDHNEALLQRLMREHDGLPGPWSGADDPLPPLADVLVDLQRAHGFDPDEYPGLFRWRDGVTAPGGTLRTRLRKLALRPRAFFEDSRLPLLRPLRHLFRR